MFLAVVAALLPSVANSKPAVESASSGSVAISVTVGARYKVMTVTVPDGASVGPELHPNQLCLFTNSLAPTLPVMLLRPSAAPSSARNSKWVEEMHRAVAMAETVWGCATPSGKSAPNALSLADRPAGQLLVRPE